MVLLAIGSDSFGIDTARYHEIGHHDGKHYEDFAVEYPPITVAEIELFKGSTIEATGLRLAIAGLLLDLLTFATLWSVWGADAANKYLLMVSILLPFAYLVLEPLSISFAVVAFGLIHQGRERTGGVVLAIAALTKLWPLALIPAVIVQRRLRALVYTGAGLALGILIWIALYGTKGLVQVVTFRGAKGWEVGSLWGSVLSLFTDAEPRFEKGSIRIGVPPLWGKVLLLIIAGIVIAAGIRWAQRNSKGALTVAVTSIAALLLSSPLFSPQFVLWLVPWVAVLRNRSLEWLTFAVLALSLLLLVMFSTATRAPGAELDLTILARNCAVVGIAALGLGQLARSAVRREVENVP